MTVPKLSQIIEEMEGIVCLKNNQIMERSENNDYAEAQPNGAVKKRREEKEKLSLGALPPKE